MRFSEMTNADLIKQIEDDALAREVYSRLVLAEARVTDREQALEHQRDKAQESYEQAMHRVGQLERVTRDLELQVASALDTQKRLLLASPPEGIAIHNDTLRADVSGLDIRTSTERHFDCDGSFVRFTLMRRGA